LRAWWRSWKKQQVGQRVERLIRWLLGRCWRPLRMGGMRWQMGLLGGLGERERCRGLCRRFSALVCFFV
jgi:hypothetical protein